MGILRLFAGVGSVGNVFKDWGWEVASLDRDIDADIKTDIMDWDYRTYKPEYFDVIWSSRGEPSSATDPGHHRLSETCLLVLGEAADWIV